MNERERERRGEMEGGTEGRKKKERENEYILFLLNIMLTKLL